MRNLTPVMQHFLKNLVAYLRLPTRHEVIEEWGKSRPAFRLRPSGGSDRADLGDFHLRQPSQPVAQVLVRIDPRAVVKPFVNCENTTSLLPLSRCDTASKPNSQKSQFS